MTVRNPAATISSSRELFQRARRVLPGGVNSPVRAFRGVGGDPRFIREAHGACLVDVEGREYLDFIGSWGVHVLGHDHAAVRQALSQALARGTSFGVPSEGEVVLAELLVEQVPGLEMVRMVNSGTEATMSAVRLARAATGRTGLIKFRGGYHGHEDAFLVEAGSGAATLGVPSSPGVPESTVAHTAVAEYNDLDSVAGCFREADGDIACVIVEPVAGNMGCVPPAPGFLQGLRQLCDEHAAILVFDEVMTGFRVGPACAQGRFGVTPDLTTLGKVIGGGLPVGAYGGRRSHAPDRPRGPGLSGGNAVGQSPGGGGGDRRAAVPGGASSHLGASRAAGRAARPAAFGGSGKTTGVPLVWNGVGGMGSLFFSETRRDRLGVCLAGSATDRFGTFFHGMLDRGIHLPPSAFEAWFWSAAHDDDDIERTLSAAHDVLTEIVTPCLNP